MNTNNVGLGLNCALFCPVLTTVGNFQHHATKALRAMDVQGEHKVFP